MTIDFKEQNVFVEAQPAVIAAIKNHRQRWQKIQEADRNVIQQARKVTSLLYAFQLCIEKMYCGDGDDLSDKEEELLKKFTPGDSETWFYYYDTAQETVQSAIVDQCRKVTLADFQYKKLKEENETCEELSVARATAREEYKKLQEQKPKRGRPPTKK
tara:strand:+ start:437 stop:910 length:474 start_codon:yes stop_codon:yes gene_type:complete